MPQWMFKFVVTFALCFTMGKAHKWVTFTKWRVGLGSRVVLSLVFWGCPYLGASPYTLKFFSLNSKFQTHVMRVVSASQHWNEKWGLNKNFIRYRCLYIMWCSVDWEWIFTWWMIMKMMPVLRALDEGSTPNALFWCKSSSPKAQYTAIECGIVMDNT
jgi:hypothetical protein